MDDQETRFRALFGAHYRSVRRYLHHRGVTDGRADDLASETFLVAWRRLDDVPTDDTLPWLLGVARNLHLNLRRGDRRARAFVHRLPPPEPAPPPTEPTDTTAVRDALGALASHDQELLTLVAWDGLSAAQVGQVLGCSPGTARVRLHRARQRLAEQLRKRSYDVGQDTGASEITKEEVDGRAG